MITAVTVYPVMLLSNTKLCW